MSESNGAMATLDLAKRLVERGVVPELIAQVAYVVELAGVETVLSDCDPLFTDEEASRALREGLERVAARSTDPDARAVSWLRGLAGAVIVVASARRDESGEAS